MSKLELKNDQNNIVSIFPDGRLKTAVKQNTLTTEPEAKGWPATGKQFHPGPQPQKAYTMMPNGVVLPEGEFVAEKRRKLLQVDSDFEIMIGKYYQRKKAHEHMQNTTNQLRCLNCGCNLPAYHTDVHCNACYAELYT